MRRDSLSDAIMTPVRRAIVGLLVALAAATAAGEARAEGGWGLHDGDTLRRGDHLLYAEGGWPDAAIGYQHGVSDVFDIGVRLAFDHGLMHTTVPQAGFSARVPMRIAIVKSRRVSFLFRADPGVKIDRFPKASDVRVGLQLPIGGFELGFHATPKTTIALGVDAPFYLKLTDFINFAFVAPILFGPAFEHHFDDHWSLGVNTRAGWAFSFGRKAASAFALVTQAGLAHRF